MAKLIPLSQGLSAIVDDEDFDALCTFGKWFAHASRHTYYAECKKNGVCFKMHRLITRPGELIVDHINHNGLDNRKANLRVVTDAQNKTNKRRYINNTSGHPGVYYQNSGRGRKRWCAQFTRKGKQKLLGKFLTKEEAISARERAENEANSNN